MNLRSVDLNLLVILDALLDEAHVSRAARRVGLSQPAVSAALERCRGLFRDPLLERGRGTMHLTAKAESLRAPLKNLLAELNAILDPSEVPLSNLRQAMRLIMSDHPASVVLAPLLQRLRDTSPGIDLIVQPWRGAAAVLEALEKGDADLSLSVFLDDGPTIQRRHVLDEHYLVLMRSDHPAAANLDLDSWLAYPHVVVSGHGQAQSPLDRQLAEIGRERRIGIVVPSFLIVPALVLSSDYMALLPSRCIPETVEGSLATFEPPISIEGFPLHIAWHARRDKDAGVRHVAELIEALLR